MRTTNLNALRALFALLFFAVMFVGCKNTGSGAEADAQAADSTAMEEAPQEATGSFDYTAPTPADGKMLGVVELGAAGFNSFIINVDAQKNWELKKAEYGASLVYENMATQQDILNGLKQYINNMIEYGVAGKSIHFVVSSSASREEAVQKIGKALKTIGYVVNEVTAEKEGQLAFVATMPNSFSDKAFVVDIGSGNTKISWMEGGEIKSVETYGAKYYQNEVSDETAYQEAFNMAEKVPAGKREVCFIIGGAPFQMAKETREGEERYTVLKTPEAYKSVLEGEKNMAGINLYNAIRQATGANTFVFDWDSNFTIGFLLEL